MNKHDYLEQEIEYENDMLCRMSIDNEDFERDEPQPQVIKITDENREFFICLVKDLEKFLKRKTNDEPS